MSHARTPKGLPLRLVMLALFASALPLIARDAPAATGFACGDGKPNLTAKKCDCPAGKVESTNGKGVSSCVDAPKPTSSSKPVGSASAKPSAAASAAAPAAGKCPAGMASIPAGTFKLDETKQSMTIGAFCVDVNEVTVLDYAACITANSCAKPGTWTLDGKLGAAACNHGREGRALHPINCVVWEEASAYCSYAKKRLLTDEEWEWVARNGDQASKYPWGAAPPDESRANVCGAECPPHFKAVAPRLPIAMITGDDGFAETSPVGSFPKGQNRWGVNDLAGNVWEWTSTSDASAKSMGSQKIIRGGSFLSEETVMLESGTRAVTKTGDRTWGIGFRCARSM
jgi:formylglycine-generating enzyme required for sulfatase activity